MRSIALIMVLATEAAANPDPVATTEHRPTEPRPPPPVVPADGSGTALPGNESGRVDPGDGGDSTGRQVGRVLLFVPHVLVDLAFLPVRGGIWATERYSIDERLHRLFFYRNDTIGVYPIAWYGSGYGGTLGGRFFDNDLLGKDEHLRLSASIGQGYSSAAGSFRTGNRLGDRLEIEVQARYDHRPREFFFGIGNGDSAPLPPAPLDPVTSGVAVETRFKERLERATGMVDLRLSSALTVRGGGSISDYTFGTSNTGPDIETVYDTNALPGFAGFRDVYAEGELVWDTRRRVRPMEPKPIYTAGSLASVFGGRVFLKDGPNYWRYGVDLQHFIRIAESPRVLSLRFHGEGVTGSIDEVPFVELPQLGGGVLLRGYQWGRFRDRVGAVASAEYTWDLSRFLATTLFADVGRVYSSLDDVGVRDLRLGYGVALEFHSLTSYLMNVSLASSIDGGLFVNLLFSSVYSVEERVRRE